MTLFIILGEDQYELGHIDRMYKFWPEQGFELLQTISEKKPELLEHIIIKTDKGYEMTVETFVGKLEKLKFKR